MTQLDHVRFHAPVSTAYTAAQADGYIRVSETVDDGALQAWRAWCTMYQLPVIQVHEHSDSASVSVNLDLVARRLCATELEWLQRWWELSEPFPDAACELAAHQCTFPGLRRPQALALVYCVLALLQGPSLR